MFVASLVLLRHARLEGAESETDEGEGLFFLKESKGKALVVEDILGLVVCLFDGSM